MSADSWLGRASLLSFAPPASPNAGAAGSPWPRRALIAVALLGFALVLVAPLAVVFVEATRKGLDAFVAAIGDADALASIRLTLLVAAVAVPLNCAFGIAAAWAIAKFDFRGKSVLTTLIDLPFSVSPVIAGLVYVLVFGMQGWFGPSLADHGLKVIYALPGILLATVFVTVPFVARALIPLMQARGNDEEEVGSSRVDLQACKLEYSIVSPK